MSPLARKPKPAALPLPTELPTLAFPTQAAWHKWLASQHRSAPGLWLKYAKKDSGIPSIIYVEAVEEALCFGWIDGQSKSVDEVYWVQRFTPRRKRSKWSKINCGRVAELIRQGRMQPAGQQEIDAAQADGRWEMAYDSPSTATVPEDLQQALKKNRPAREFFAQLDANNRYSILHRLHHAQKPEIRARTLKKFLEMLSKGQVIHAPRKKAKA